MKKSLNPSKNLRSAPVSEIFVSFQGEGICLGQPQIFVRFSGCNLRCSYCDTPKSQFRVPSSPAGRHGTEFTVKKLLKKILTIRKLSTINYQLSTVSLTGGEPLLHADFLSELLPVLRSKGFKIYLETNGTLAGKFKKIKKWVDIVAMDIKLKSACGKTLWKNAGEFLKEAGRKAFVKVIVDNLTGTDEIRKAVRIVAKVEKKTPFVLQPVTPVSGRRSARPLKFYDWISIARKSLSSVSVIPQMHKIWKVR
jgi:7-carboxy-7-deazaguanine synthase